MKTRLLTAACSALLMAGGNSEAADTRSTMVAACETQQGIGWLKRQHGAAYCECWADAAKKILSPENYDVLGKAVQFELAAADKADREKIYREHTAIYSTVASAAKSCARKKK